MSFAVSKCPPVMVRPSMEPAMGKTTGTQLVQLSSWDRSYVGFHVAALLIFDGPVVAAKQWLMLDRGGMGLVYLDITVPLKLINRIKSEYRASHTDDGGYCTTFEAAVAVLWRCRTRAIIGDDPDYDMSAPAPLAFFVNVREHVGAAAGFYGNCAVAQVAFATIGEVAGAGDGGMNEVVDLIKRAKDGVPELLRNMGGGGGAVPEMGEEEMAAAFGYNALMAWHREEHAAAFLAELDQLAHAPS
ncbi:hypothetical protein TRIUR3_31528 [Triticum urartu]|uniref:Uncharacterized protein n=1 Tax=Triticum urartu TaxID=4572 RepID=M7Z8L0_TRIUA|nr:hypothetical protein TRIUR3_31528 [Triticum urartu]